MLGALGVLGGVSAGALSLWCFLRCESDPYYRKTWASQLRVIAAAEALTGPHDPVLGSKSSKASPVSDRQPPHLNPMLVACESAWRALRAKRCLPNVFYAQSSVRGDSGVIRTAVLAAIAHF